MTVLNFDTVTNIVILQPTIECLTATERFNSAFLSRVQLN